VDNFLPSPIERYANVIAALPVRDRFGKSDLLIPEFRLFRDNSLEIYYAPFDFANAKARVAIVGITPGWTQMEMAFRHTRLALKEGLSFSDGSQEAKKVASFAGAMRNNLVKMLNEIGLQKALGVESCVSLFGNATEFLHTTSAIRYPTFVRGRNYTGHSPEILSHPILVHFVEHVLAPELVSMPGALVIPLGKCVDTVLGSLVKAGSLDAKACLLGFPHPSGANGHRRAEFEQGRDMLSETVGCWAKGLCGSSRP
jgi:hypothetical protein